MRSIERVKTRGFLSRSYTLSTIYDKWVNPHPVKRTVAWPRETGCVASITVPLIVLTSLWLHDMHAMTMLAAQCYVAIFILLNNSTISIYR